MVVGIINKLVAWLELNSEKTLQYSMHQVYWKMNKVAILLLC